MQLQLNLQMDDVTTNNNVERVKKATAKKKAVKAEPTWEEVWQKIMATKLSDTDRERVIEVRQAIDSGEMGTGVKSLKKFSKAHALNLHKKLVGIRKLEWIKEMIEHKPDNYFLVNTKEMFYDLLIGMKSEKYIGLDTETTGLIQTVDYIVGISITLPTFDKHYYIPIRHNVEDFQLGDVFVLRLLKPFLEDEKLGKILHNAKFDSHMFYSEGIDLKGIIMDTQIAMHVLNENEMSYALKNIATKYGRYFGFEKESHTYEELFGKGGFENTPLDIGHIYACKDTHLVVQLYKWILTFFEKQPNLAEAHAIEMEVLKVSIEMERNGVLIDLDFGANYKVELQDQIDSIDKKINEYLGGININSNVQLMDALKTMGILDDKAKSVDADALKNIQHKHEVVALILKLREFSKLQSTYITPLPTMVRETGRLHGRFNQSQTVTGRYSSSDPNLQNIPPEARGLFVAPEGKMFVGIDLSQIEPRYLAHISNDIDFQQPYLIGGDLYSSLASKTFKVPLEECGDGTKYRKSMKVGLLACMYGISDYQLGISLGITTEEATQFMKEFMDSYPITKAWIESIHGQVQIDGHVQILGGRKRRFPEIQIVSKQFHALNNRLVKQVGHEITNIWIEKKIKYDDRRAYWELSKKYYRALRQSVNAIIQGSCATILKKAMVELYYHCKKKGDDWKFILTIHDENILEVPDTATPEELQELVDIMCSPVKLRIPMKADCEVMKVWGQGVPMKEWVANGCKFD